MKKLLTSKPLAYKTALKHLLAFFMYLLLNYAFPFDAPVCISGYGAMCATELSPIITGLFCVLSAFICGGGKLFTTTSIAVLILCGIFTIYRARKNLPEYELLIFIPSALIHYIVFFDGDIYLKIITATIITVLTFLITADLNYLFTKGLKYKPSVTEYLTLCAVALLLGLGLINLLSAQTVWALGVLIILCVCKIFSGEICFYTAILIGVPFAVYYTELTYIACTVIIATTVVFFSGEKYRLSSVLTIGVDYLLRAGTEIYLAYDIYDFLLILSAVLIFCLIPQTFFDGIKENFNSTKTGVISKRTINKAHARIADKLYDLSEVFTEISCAFDELKKRELPEEETRKLIVEKTYQNTCQTCERLSTCKNGAKNFVREVKCDLEKTVKIGMAKGKISFIDLPPTLSSRCFNTNSLIFSINKDLSEYRTALIDNANFSLSRELIAKQSLGISETLKTLATTTGKELSFNADAESKLLSSLKRKGLIAYETLIYGDGDETEVSIIIGAENFSPNAVEKAVNKALGINLKITEFTEFTQGKFYLHLLKPCPYKAVYGVASATKTSSETTGDAHSESLLYKNRFTFALSDGMGSGKRAETISSITLSLIESLYKAGLSSETVLPLVNKILSINTDDSFSALDICSVDLNTLTADFIKFGAPRGFILSENDIKIVEGSSLPIGIISEVEPLTVTASLLPNDILVLMTDGVADAYGSTTEIIDKLKILPAKNPTSVAETLLNGAMEKCNQILKDDMTVLVVRIIKNTGVNHFDDLTVA